MKTRKHDEIHLQLAWVRQKHGAKLRTNREEDWILLSPGTWNLEAGPDFLDAKIKVDGQEIKGDVEIHKKTTDWRNHRHSENPEYSNVILHVVGIDDSNKTVEKKNLPNIPTMIITPSSATARIASKDKFPSGRCSAFFSAYDDETLRKLFTKAGVKKFMEKSSVILDEMEKAGVETAVKKRIFEACGYKHNREQFLELFSRIISYGKLNPKTFKILIWGESDLIPDPSAVSLSGEMKKFTINLWSEWWKLRKNAKEPIKWHRSSNRPVNSPERRIAGIAVLFDKLGLSPTEYLSSISKEIAEPSEFIKKLREFFICSDSLWDTYYSFTTISRKAMKVIGQSRADDIIVNSILPSLYAYGIITNNTALKKLVEKTYISIPKAQDNRILKTASLKWFMPPSRQKNIFKNASAQQGAIYLFRGFCSEYCQECEKCPLNNLIQTCILRK